MLPQVEWQYTRSDRSMSRIGERKRHAAQVISVRRAGSLRSSSNLPGAFPGRELSGCANTSKVLASGALSALLTACTASMLHTTDMYDAAPCRTRQISLSSRS